MFTPFTCQIAQLVSGVLCSGSLSYWAASCLLLFNYEGGKEIALQNLGACSMRPGM